MDHYDEVLLFKLDFIKITLYMIQIKYLNKKFNLFYAKIYAALV